MASTLMKFDPFTLKVALDKKGSALGELYLDDGETYSHEKGQLIWRRFSAQTASKVIRLTSEDLATIKPSDAVDGASLKNIDPANPFATSISVVRVERVVIMGLSSEPTSVKLEGGKELRWDYVSGVSAGEKKEGTSSVLTIKDPKVLITNDWSIIIQL